MFKHYISSFLCFIVLFWSHAMQVSADGKKVRRSTPLVEPQDVEERTVYVENVPQDTTVETMERDFGRCGSVEYIQWETMTVHSIII